jgi:pimeloyl-ACP methyl ester carboxylesterase
MLDELPYPNLLFQLGNRLMPRVSANGLKFHVQQAGSGPAVALIHGLTGDLSIWFLSRTIQALAESFRVTAYDLRGHGYSDAPASGYTSLDHAHDLIALFDALGIDRASLVGHSFGAVIAVHAAVVAPDRIEALVLSDPYFPGLRHLEDVSRWGHWQNFRTQAENAGVSLSSDTWYDLTTFFDQVLHLDEERLLRFRQAVGLPALKRVLRLAETTCGQDSKLADGLTGELIASVPQPCLALYGENSPFLTTADYLVKHLPQCQGRRIASAQHRAPEENAEGFVTAVREFLESLRTPLKQEACL